MLTCVVQTLDALPELAKDPAVAKFFSQWGGVEALRVHILRDFFRNAFNGDGDDGGSCIDGKGLSWRGSILDIHPRRAADEYMELVREA